MFFFNDNLGHTFKIKIKRSLFEKQYKKTVKILSNNYLGAINSRIKSQAGLNSYKISVKEFERLKAEEQK